MLSVHTFTGIGAGAARATLRVEKNTESFIKNFIRLTAAALDRGELEGREDSVKIEDIRYQKLNYQK
jgi:hypothetical protein